MRSTALDHLPEARAPLFSPGSSMAAVFTVLDRVARTEATVLIRGETGTGKELLAQEIHRRSARAARRFVRTNCAAFADGLLESELFGHEVGSFTGAVRSREGRFESAAGGTLFLDEIGDIPPRIQVLLLRVLQEHEFERVGSSETRRSDVRIVAATHQDLEALVQQGLFREDLFYRLNVVPLYLPPLRERPDDVPVLARAFLAELGCSMHKDLVLSQEAMDVLVAQRWPGNVRQLKNVLERAAALAPSVATLTADDLISGTGVHLAAPSGGVVRICRDQARHREATEITEALRASDGSIAAAARKLGVPRTTLHDRMRRLRL